VPTGEPEASAAMAAFPPTLSAAEQRLADFNVSGYARTRNHLEGNVSRLSPYVTWGVFTPRELLGDVTARHGRRDNDLSKFTAEVGWKAYFREVFRALGARVYTSLEPYKYPRGPEQEGWPEGIEDGKTGVACIDTLTNTLLDTGYLHNHGRMWLAAWWTHYARHSWQEGERFLYRHLLDGEPGPNAVSWQWVASTFAHKPYAFNVDNMRRFGLEGCDRSPFDVSYETLDTHFFGGYREGGYAPRPDTQPRTVAGPPFPQLLRPSNSAPMIVLHAERLSTRAATLAAFPSAPVAVYLDARRLMHEQPSRKRLAFALHLAQDLVRNLEESGRQAALFLLEDEQELVQQAHAWQRDGAVVPDSWHPGTWRTLQRLDEHLPVSVQPDTPLAEVNASLRSFSAYWRKAEPQVLSRFAL